MTILVSPHPRSFALQARRAFVTTTNSAPSHTNATRTAVPLQRWKSSVASNQCPHHAERQEPPVAAAATTTATSMDKVELVDVPKLPWIGSLISRHSGISKVDFRNVYNSWYQNRIKFGHFYNIGLPHSGKGIYRDSKYEYDSSVVVA